jgi:hypothetical protein
MSEPESGLEEPRSSIWKRLFICVGLLVFLLVVLAVGGYFFQVSNARGRLARIMADLDEGDPGWRLDDIEAARPTLPEEGNSARVVMAVYRMMPKGALDYKVLEPLDKLPPPPELLEKARADLLQRELEPLAPAVELARSLAEMPAGRHQLTIAPNPILTLLPDQQNTRATFNLLRYDVLDLGQKGDGRAALRSCRALVNAARSLDDEPFIISQLVRIAGIGVAASAIERSLAQGEPPAEELARLQKLLEEEEGHRTLLVALRGERALQHKIFTGLTNGSININEVTGGGAGGDWGEVMAGWFQAILARREHPEIMEMMSRAIAAARLPEHEQLAAEKELDEALRSLPRSIILVRLLMPGMSKVAAAARRKTAMVRCLRVLLALERYRLDKKAWPAKLEELTPQYLSSVPLDPYDGKALRYRRVKDGVIVYSVGPDGTDDGGNIDRTAPTKAGTDLGYQLWDAPHRRQPSKTPMAK